MNFLISEYINTCLSKLGLIYLLSRLVSELKCGVRNQEFVGLFPGIRLSLLSGKARVLCFLLFCVQAFIQMERLSVKLKQVLDGNN